MAMLSAFAPYMSGAAAVVAAFFSWRSHGEIQKVEVNINSKMSAFLALTEKAAMAEGVAAGRAQAAEAVLAAATAATDTVRRNQTP